MHQYELEKDEKVMLVRMANDYARELGLPVPEKFTQAQISQAWRKWGNDILYVNHLKKLEATDCDENLVEKHDDVLAHKYIAGLSEFSLTFCYGAKELADWRTSVREAQLEQKQAQLAEAKQRRKAEMEAEKERKNAKAAQKKAQRLLDLQSDQFYNMARQFTNAILIEDKLSILSNMLDLLGVNPPKDLQNVLQEFLFEMADSYASGRSSASDESVRDMLLCLLRVPSSESLSMHMQRIFLKRITNILLSDSQTEKPTRFQEDSIRALEMMINNGVLSLVLMQHWVSAFIEESSGIFLREKYIRNRSNKVEQLEQCGREMDACIIHEKISPVPQNHSVYEARVEGSAENNNNDVLRVRHSPVPPVDYPPVINAHPVPITHAFPDAARIESYLQEPQPVEYGEDSSAPSLAQLTANVRQRESNAPVRGVDEMQTDVEEELFVNYKRTNNL